MHFIDRLQQALQRQTDNAQTRDILLLKLAVENANSDCKKLLKSLLNQNPSLVEMIEACNRIRTMRYKYETMTAAFAAMNPLLTARCFGCGKLGHFRKNCFTTRGGNNRKTSLVCLKCD